MMKHATSVLIVTTAVALAGCGSFGASSEVAVPQADEEDLAALADNDEDLAWIVANAHRSMSLLDRATTVLVADCMAEQGFDYTARTNTDVGLESRDLTVGLLTPEAAERSGYGLYISDSSDGAREPGNEYFDSLGPDERARFLAALDGGGDAESVELPNSLLTHNVGGCYGDAHRQMLGDQVIEVFDTYAQLQVLPLSVDLERMPDVASSIEDWRECMNEAGHEFDTPGDAIQYGLEQRGSSTQPTDSEVALATDDAECRQRVDLAPVMERNHRLAHGRILAENEALLLTWIDLEQFVLRESGDVLGVPLERVET
jgi:hypothetical protein